MLDAVDGVDIKNALGAAGIMLVAGRCRGLPDSLIDTAPGKPDEQCVCGPERGESGPGIIVKAAAK